MITGPIRQDGPIDILQKIWSNHGGVTIIIGIILYNVTDLIIFMLTLIFVSLSLGALGY